MDLTRYDTRELAHEGVDVPLVLDGEAVMGDDDEPVTFRLKGVADPEVMRVMREIAKGTGGANSDLKLLRVAVAGWSDNWTLEGEHVAFSPEGLAKVFAVPVIRRAVVAEVFRDANFMKGS